MLAAVVAGAVPPDWTVYAGPPEVTSNPCAVIQVANTRPGTFCALVYRMTVTALEARSSGLAGYDSVETMAATITEAVTGIEGLVYESTDQGPMIAPGGVEAYGATLNLELYV
jgi:hypothetical protein